MGGTIDRERDGMKMKRAVGDAEGRERLKLSPQTLFLLWGGGGLDVDDW